MQEANIKETVEANGQWTNKQEEQYNGLDQQLVANEMQNKNA